MENQTEDVGGIEESMTTHRLSDIPNIDEDNENDGSISSSQNITTNTFSPIDSQFFEESKSTDKDENLSQTNAHIQTISDPLLTQNIKVEILNSDQKGLGSDMTNARILLSKLDSEQKVCDKRYESTESLLSVESLNEQAQPDTESESQSDANLLNTGKESKLNDSPLVKRTKRHKARSVKDSNSKQLVIKKKKGPKTQIKSKFTPGSMEYIQQNLANQIFSGWIEERKWIDSIGGYRDLVQVDEWETQINRHIKAITNSIPGVVEGTKWINITGPLETEPCCCFWVLMPTPPTPGHYWFQVTNIAIEPLFGLRVHLKMIRNLHVHDGETKEARQRRRELLLKLDTPEAVVQSFGQQVEMWFDHIRNMDQKAVLSSVAKTITFHNIKETIRFTIVLLVTIVVGLIHFGKEAWFFSVRFIREAGIFFRNITPFLQSILRFVEKLIGGFYVLLAMVYHDIRYGPRPTSYSSAGPPVAYLSGPNGPPQLALPPGTHPQYMAPNMASTMSQQPSGPRYVPATNWVYKRQNTSDHSETS